MDVGCETALRAVRDGLIGGCLAMALGVIYLKCITSVNTMSVVAKARKLKERLFQFLKPRAYPAIGLDFPDKPLNSVAWLVNVNTTYNNWSSKCVGFWGGRAGTDH